MDFDLYQGIFEPYFVKLGRYIIHDGLKLQGIV